jgi:hypothetical protein
MDKVRRIGLATLATALTFGLLGIAAPAEARDTSWGRGAIVAK